MNDPKLVTQLRTTMGRLEAALGAVEEGLAFTDLEGIVEWTNASFDRFVGRSRLQCLGIDLASLLPRQYQAGQSVAEECGRFWEGHRDGRATWELSPSSPRRVIDVTWATVNVPNKPSLVFTFRDQSAIVEAQDRLVESRDQLEVQVELRTRELQQARDEALAASQSKTRFLASMSHEIRTPLNAVIGMAELLMDSPLGAIQKEMVETIHDSGEHLLELINDILDISQIETGRLRLSPRAFNLPALLDECQNLFRYHASSRKLGLSFSLSPELPKWLYGDDLKLRQILFNVLSNACKYTNHGSVLLSAEVAAAEGNEWKLRFRVADTGIGIPAQLLPSIFEEFTRHPDPAQTKQSAGLGLAICSRLCQLMGGTISVKTRLGEGSCFTVQLPFLLTHQPRAAAGPAVAVAGSGTDFDRGLGILVDDDSCVNQRVLQLMLARLDLQPELVSDGEAAIDRIEAGGIDLVFMDVEMPRLDGIAATRKLRSAGHADLYVIALTAYSFSSHRRECEAAGMNDFVTKPLRPDDLCAALNRFREWRHRKVSGVSA